MSFETLLLLQAAGLRHLCNAACGAYLKSETTGLIEPIAESTAGRPSTPNLDSSNDKPADRAAAQTDV